MHLESLANEVFLEIFEHLPVIHLFHAFHDLNGRLTTLLLKHVRLYRLDFRSVSKSNFDIFCEKHLPLIVDRIGCLCLSDEDESPQQIQCFLSCAIDLRQLISLQSLSLSHLRSSVMMNQLMIACQHLPHLTHLRFTNCSFRNDHQTIFSHLNDLWTLPKLKHCHVDIDFECGQIYIIAPSVVSRSLESLSIGSYCYKFIEIARLVQNTPCLRYLCVLFKDDSLASPLSLTIPSLITLKVVAFESPSMMTNLLENVPNLRFLTVETDEINVDGHYWKRLIVNHLPQLSKFHLKMIFRLDDNENKEQRVDQLLESFRTSFWLIEQQRFVRCDWNRCDLCDKNSIYLYTLPYAFNHYYFHDLNCKSKSTDPHNHDYSSYNRVQSLEYEIVPPNNWTLSHFRFSNISHFSTSLPVEEHFWSIIPRFDRLISLQLAPCDSDHSIDNQCQLQILLDQASNLYSLTFARWPSSSTTMPPYRYLNKTVRILCLQDVDRCYNSEQCHRLSHSPLGTQCEVLSIAVEHRKNILDLINIMTNLRALNVISQDDAWTEANNHRSLTEEDELVGWLQRHLSSTCTISRNDDSVHHSRLHSIRSIRLWIR